MSYTLEPIGKKPPKMVDPQPSAYTQKTYRPVQGRAVQSQERNGTYCVVDFQTQNKIDVDNVSKVVIVQGPNHTMVRVHYRDGTMQKI